MWSAKYSLMDVFKDKQSPDAMYFDAMDDTVQLLEKYIKNNLAAFGFLK